MKGTEVWKSRTIFVAIVFSLVLVFRRRKKSSVKSVGAVGTHLVEWWRKAWRDGACDGNICSG